MHLPNLIQDLAVILGVAAVVAFLFQKIRQPVVLGYIIAGVIVGPHTPPASFVRDIDSIRVWAELGVIFLMFTLGLEFSFRKLFRVGPSASVTALMEVVFMTALGYGTGHLLGWKSLDSLFLGAMLSISSTTIIIKALDELGLKTRHFAEMIFAVLIVEDLLAILLLVFLTAISQEGAISGMTLLNSGGKLVLITGSWFLVGYFIIPRLLKSVARVGTTETLTIVSLGLCLGLVVFAAHFHYSAALGAFIMGSIISETRESRRIEESMIPIRDLFAAIFFVSVGMLINPAAIIDHWGAVLLITSVTIIGKIATTSFGALITGQTTANSVRVGFGLAQIGEFSFIIAGLGMSLGVVSDFLYPIGVAVSLVTTFTTPYLIRVSGGVADRLDSVLPFRVKRIQQEWIRWSRERRGDPRVRERFRRSLMRWAASGILVTLTFILVAEWVAPFFPRRWIGWVASCVICAPFIWSMLTSFRIQPGTLSRGVLTRSFTMVFFNLVTIFWIGALSASYFPTHYALISTAVAAVLILLAFRRNLEISYHWFERRFMDTFEPEGVSEESRKQNALLDLAPWDAHLVRVAIHPNSTLVGKSLLESELRTRQGVNVVVIQRGTHPIVAPSPNEVLYPHDELLMLGTDEQIEKVRAVTDAPVSQEAPDQKAQTYDLRAVRIGEGSPLTSRSIRESQIRTRFLAMVVGVERHGTRISNPDSELVIQSGDLLWVVGPKSSLDAMK